jgi:hypothetical protein
MIVVIHFDLHADFASKSIGVIQKPGQGTGFANINL